MVVLEAPPWLPAQPILPGEHRIGAESHEQLAERAADAPRDTAWVWLVGLEQWPHPERAPRLINRITSGPDSQFPPIHFRSPFSQAPWVESEASHPVAAAYAALTCLHAAELVQLVALPSDVSTAECERALSALQSAMAPLSDATPESVPMAVLRAIKQDRHYTHSAALQLERLCHRHRALYAQWPDPDLCRKDTARATLACIEQRLVAFETHYT